MNIEAVQSIDVRSSLLLEKRRLKCSKSLVIGEMVIHLTAWFNGLKCRAMTTIKFNCIYMLALGIVASIIWAWTSPSRFGCNDGICVVTILWYYPTIWFIDHWNSATCLNYSSQLTRCLDIFSQLHTYHEKCT